MRAPCPPVARHEGGVGSMVTALEVVVAAFVAQLLVLPGEKVQFIIAGLSTRYNPLTVVAAAGSAFAGWTALEIAFGEALTTVLPALVLDLFTAGMFLVFAVLLVRSAPGDGIRLLDRSGGHAHSGGEPGSPGDERPPRPNGGVSDESLEISLLGREVPHWFGGFLPIFVMMAVGEFGDKTQLVTITLAARFGAHPGIWVGEMLAIVPVSLANAYLFHRFAHRVDLRKAHLAGAVIFLFFGLDTLLAAGTGISLWETAVQTIADVVLAA
jgi:putative Ca2+/H+ antiporter (TMEM165/GDT1 family)